MFFHLQYIHLFRPFLKYGPSASPLPAHVSPRRICTANAGAISKLMRLYKKTWNLRQICNIAVYMTHSACTIHLLNLPEKTARRDITHGVKHLEEIAEDWLCARRTLSILSVLARKWRCELPEDAAFVLQRADEKYGYYSPSDVPSPNSQTMITPSLSEKGLGPRGPSGEISPLSQYAQVRMSQNSPQAPVDPVMSFNSPLDPMTGMTQQQPVSLGASEMGYTSTDLGPWSQPSPNNPNMANFGSPFGSMQQQHQQRSSLNPESVTSQPNPRPVPSGSGVNIDGPDWFLNDSARWQQSFETWGDMGGPSGGGGGGGPSGGGGVGGAGNANGSSVFMFGDGRSGSADGRPMRSDGGEQQHVADFEGLGTSLSGGGWLPGLD